MSELVCLVDGYSIIYRSYFAFINRPLYAPDGRNASAVFGFTRALLNLLRTEEPTHLAVVLDPAGPTFRHTMYPAYKATRDKAPEELHEQVPVIVSILDAMGIPVLRVDGYEADDVIATIAVRSAAAGLPCRILTGDKDILQLVDDRVSVLESARGAGKLTTVGPDDVFARRGVHPHQIVDYLALVGDQSDNVPGVRGVGDKTAVKLLAQYGDLDTILASLESITPPGLRNKLDTGREQALLSRSLVVLDREVPIDRDVADLLVERPAYEQAIPLLLEMGITSIAKELGWSDSGESGESITTAAVSAPEAVPQAVPEDGRKGTYALVVEPRDLEGWVERVLAAGECSFDVETNSLDELQARPIGFSLSVAGGEGCYIPLCAKDVEVLSPEVVQPALCRILEDPGVAVVGQNIKYDYKVTARWGVTMRRPFFDTMIAAWLLDPGGGGYGLDELARKYLGYTTVHYQDLIPRGEDRTLADVEISRVVEYAAEDADIAFRLYGKLAPMLETSRLAELFHTIEMPLLPILARMELAGIRLLPDALHGYSVELAEDIARIDREIYALCGREFNINSTKQLQQVLFEERELTPLKKTKTGYSTDSSVLEILAQEDPVAERVLDHRGLAKLKSTYVDALPGMIDPTTERLHTHFLQTGTATGRIASRDPNLQNIPVREESGRRIREAFVPRPGWSFMSFDYSQIELAVLASLSRDPMLMEAVTEGRDIHTQTASLIFGVDQESITAEQRRIGKTINFGVIYGMSGFRLSRSLKISRKDADAFIAVYFQTYAGVRQFIDRTVLEAESTGWVATLMGRKREIRGITSRNRVEKAAAERVAVNTPIQGSAADIVKKAMIDVDREITARGLDARLLLQVHDELVLEVPGPEIELTKEVVRVTMEQAVELAVPLRVSVEVASSWGSIH